MTYKLISEDELNAHTTESRGIITDNSNNTVIGLKGDEM